MPSCQVAHMINQLSKADRHLSATAFFSSEGVLEVEDMLALFPLVSLPFSVLNTIYKQIFLLVSPGKCSVILITMYIQ